MWLNRTTVRMRPVWDRYWDLRLVQDRGAIPESGGLIVACNHASFLDPWFLSILFPRPVHHLINRAWYDRSSAWRTFFRANGTVPVEPGDPSATSRAISGVLDGGGVLSIFPEGKISSDGRPQRFRSGIAFIAAETGASVLPVGLRGAYETLPRTARFPQRGEVSLHVGEPMRFPGAPTAEPPRRDLVRFRDALRTSIVSLAGFDGADVRAPRDTPSPPTPAGPREIAV